MRGVQRPEEGSSQLARLAHKRDAGVIMRCSRPPTDHRLAAQSVLSVRGVQRPEEGSSQVAHLAYERNADVIVMKGYKFAWGRIPAASCLACLALANEQAASFIAQVGLSWSRLLGLHPD